MPTTTHGYSMLKFALLNDAFSEFFKLEASPVKGQSLQKKREKREKRKRHKKLKKPEKPRDVVTSLFKSYFKFLISMLAQAKMSKRGASGKTGIF